MGFLTFVYFAGLILSVAHMLHVFINMNDEDWLEYFEEPKGDWAEACVHIIFAGVFWPYVAGDMIVDGIKDLIKGEKS